MKAITFQGIESVLVKQVPDPVIIQPFDVIVHVNRCAVCGSDLHVYHGREAGIDQHTVMGHEFSGTVVETGREVKFFQKGDRVMSPFTTSCGECFYCMRGLSCRCVKSQLFGWVQNGHGLHGGQAEFVRVPLADHTLVRVPEELDMDLAVLLGDIIPTGFYCARQGQIKPGDVVAVVGCGPVGLMAILGAYYYGASRVFAIDMVKSRLKIAAEFGGDPVDPKNSADMEKIFTATQGRGPDAVLEAVGSSSSVKLAFDLIRPGGTLSAVGVCTENVLPFSPVQAYDKNLTYRIGRCPARSMMEELIPVVVRNSEKFRSVITHTVSLEDGPMIYDQFASRKEGMLKVLFRPE